MNATEEISASPFLDYAATIAPIITLFIAILTISLYSFRLYEKIENELKKWRKRKITRNLVIIPTPDEIAKFSVKVPQKHYAEEKLHNLKILSATREDLYIKHRKYRSRVMSVMLSFILFWGILAGSFINTAFPEFFSSIYKQMGKMTTESQIIN